MKGQRLFNDAGTKPVTDLFGNAPTWKEKKKGRSPAYIIERDERLVARLHFYRTYFPHLKNEVVMKILMFEFNLSDIRITEVLATLAIEIQRIKNENPDLKTMKEKWFSTDWNPNMNIPKKFLQ